LEIDANAAFDLVTAINDPFAHDRRRTNRCT
jgi:hypothetical protein